MELNNWVKIYREAYSTIGLNSVIPFNGLNEVLELLTEKGIIIIIISNKGEKAIHDTLKKFNLHEFVDLIIEEKPGIAKKPSPDVYEKVIKEKYPHVDPSKVIMVGDTVADIEFANNVGMDSCWAAYGYGNKEDCKSLKPTIIVNNLLEILSDVSGK